MFLAAQADRSCYASFALILCLKVEVLQYVSGRAKCPHKLEGIHLAGGGVPVLC